MTHVGPARLCNRVVIPLYDLVEVPRRNLCHLVKPLEIEGLVLAAHERGQCNRCEVAHSHLVRRCVLNDFRAEVGAVDCAQVLLVGLPVGMVLVKHVRGTSFHLCLEDAEPELLRFDRLVPLAISLKLRVESLKLVTPDVEEPFASLRVECFALTVLC